MFATPPAIHRLAASSLFTEADLYQARFAASLCPPAHGDLAATLTALVSLAVREGHVCLDLNDADTRARLAGLGFPTFDPAGLTDTGVVTGPDDPGPLILHGSRLYFARFFRDEDFLGRTILALAASPSPNVDIPADILGRGVLDDGQPDWQAVALLAALQNQFCVISGGPGTGKTHTVAQLLHLAARTHGRDAFTIGLAAPTGKAAGRMSESLAKAFGGALPQDLAACLPHPAQTVHRLLGWQPGGQFRHHRGNPLALNMLVVDEVSMLDMELAARLLEALPEGARLVLLGDRNQLASVEAGAVLANLCPAAAINRFSEDFARQWTGLTGAPLPVAETPCPLTDHVVELRKSWRFGPDSGIAALAGLIRDGWAEDAAAFLETPHADVTISPCAGAHQLREELAPLVRAAFGGLGQNPDPAQAFVRFEALRILSPVRQGPRGAETLNRLAREILGFGRDDHAWYPGRPVMIRENDYNLGLFNGDVGIALPVDGALRVFFPGPDGFTSLSPARLPRFETCYCMTVHKRQGSEFDHAVLVLPEEPCPVLGRELLYTALTRAKRRFTLIGRSDQVATAVNAPARRDSGLGEMLRGA